jgi:hypothetical protein
MRQLTKVPIIPAYREPRVSFHADLVEFDGNSHRKADDGNADD